MVKEQIHTKPHWEAFGLPLRSLSKRLTSSFWALTGYDQITTRHTGGVPNNFYFMQLFHFDLPKTAIFIFGLNLHEFAEKAHFLKRLV